MKFKSCLAWLMVYLAAVSLLACGKSSTEKNGNPASQSGAVSVALTDAPGDFDHVWITVKDVWFHVRDDADPRATDWRKFPLPAPVTIDLLTLANGGNDVNNGIKPLWSGLTLAAGVYKQIRIVLVDTTDPLTASATAAGIGFNNEVVIGGNEYPLHIPDARHGISLIGSFNVIAGGTLRLAVDFDAGEDIVEFHDTDYVLKPRLAYFDLDNAGAITGKIDVASAGTITSGRFVVKAEHLSADGSRHVVRRWTVPDPVTGRFVLYPLPAAAASTYDVLIRGLNYQTVIVKDVPAARGTTPSSGGGATDLGTIAMTQATTPDYAVNASIASPTGAWVNFSQTLTGSNEVPYEVRFRHFAPLTGKFFGFPLSNMPISVGTFTSGTISFATNTPLGGAGGYQAVAGAVLFDPGSPVIVTAPTGTAAVALNLPALTVSSPFTGNQVTGSISMAPTLVANPLDRGVLFAVHRGMIVNAINIGTADVGGGGQIVSGGTYTISSLPGGSAATPLPGAFYGIEAVGWNHVVPRLHRAVAVPQVVDLRTADDTADMLMVPF